MILQGLRMLVDDPTWIESPQIPDHYSRLSPATVRDRSRHIEWAESGRLTSVGLLNGTGTCLVKVAFDAKHGQTYPSAILIS